MKKLALTREQLRRCDGKEGAPAFIAYNGNVYDVSGSFVWKGGKHEVLHDAGEDLTEAMEQAPHFADVLDSFPIVGVLIDALTR